MAPTGNSEPFKKIKDENTCRIFVLGESTTIGYPYFHNGSLRYTEQVIRLERTVSKDPMYRTYADSTIASLYIAMGNQAGACVRLEKILQRDPRNPNALSWLTRLNAKGH
jgi:Tfp pilus assembly protein PilF